VIHQHSDTQRYAECDRCRKRSGLLPAATNEAVAELLCAEGWGFKDDGASHCAACADTPMVMPTALRHLRRFN
jgi:hypothetical protein